MASRRHCPNIFRAFRRRVSAWPAAKLRAAQAVFDQTGGCTRPDFLMPPANSWRFGKTWAGTTPSIS